MLVTSIGAQRVKIAYDKNSGCQEPSSCGCFYAILTFMVVIHEQTRVLGSNYGLT